MNVVYRTMHHLEAEQRRAFLEDTGIVCRILNEGVRAAAGELPFVELELVVLDPSQLDEARALLVQFEQGSQTVQAVWKCKHCGEPLEPQFTDCWSCGAAKQ